MVHNVVEVESGNEALKAILGSNFDLVISDVQLADGTGTWLVEELQKAKIDVPVILMSGDANKEDSLKLSGVSGFLTKPF